MCEDTYRKWVIGRCKYEDCMWVEARIKQDQFTTTHVTEAMVEHTEKTGHLCTQEMHYPQPNL